MQPSPAHGQGAARPSAEPLECALGPPCPGWVQEGAAMGRGPPRACPPMPQPAGCSVALTHPLRVRSPSPCLALPYASCPLAPHCSAAAPVAAPSLLRRSPDRERPFVVPLLVLLGCRVTACAFVLVTVSSKWDHLGGPRGDVSLCFEIPGSWHPYASASPLHPGTDRQTLWAVP